MIRATRFLLVSLIWFGCNGTANSTSEGIASAKEALKKEDEQVRNAYKEAYQTAIHRKTDTALRNVLLLLDSKITTSVHYMDSIYGEMSFLVDKDPTNFDYPKTLFLYKGVGDSLYSFLTRVNNIAQKVAAKTGHSSAVDSLRLTVLNQPTADAWKQQDFSVLSPFAAMALVHDFSCETFQVGKQCLP